MDLGNDPIEVEATVQLLWRYPACSLRGERVGSLAVTMDSVRGDRSHLLVDLVSGEVAAPEKIARWRPALELDARIVDGDVLVSSRDWILGVDDPELDDALSAHFGFRCAIHELAAV